jgi:hypothetical protein
MPNRSFVESRPLAELLSCAAGDVLAVRAFAETLLRTQNLSDPAYRDARLIMTAACLQLQSRAAQAPTATDLRELLVNLETSADFRSVLGASPMQFLQFAAAEVDALEPTLRRNALDICLRACRGGDTV